MGHKPFPRFEKRRVTCLDGNWDFAFLGDVSAENISPDLVDFSNTLPVPSAFDSFPDYAGMRGLAAYQTTFCTLHVGTLEIEFEGAGLWAQAFVDSVPSSPHDCGYSKFFRTWENVGPGEHTLTVLVDNRFDFCRVPLHEGYFDFYQWGGITRSVWVHEKPERFIQSIHVATIDIESREIGITVSLGGRFDGVHVLQVFCDGSLFCEIPVPGGQDVISLSHTLHDAALWDCSSPELHLIRATLGDDDMIVRFGLRSVSVSGSQLLLNGEPVTLLGFNRHESHPQFGPALPLSLVAADVMWLKRMNCNFVRGAHYPQDQRFLDLCDESGILVWEEGLGWGQKAEQLGAPQFESAHRNMIHEMIEASFNHPSVICWGFLNEAATNCEEIRPLMESTVRQIRELDFSRPITYASMFPKDDCFFDLVDIVSVNLYPGWYGCLDNSAPLELIRPAIRDVAAFLYKAHGKPVIVSEIGCEALYGWRDALNGFYTECYQGEYLKEAILEVIENPNIIGIAIWHFSDARTYSGGRAITRPRAFNNKGVLDEYRRPKESVGVVSQLFGSVDSPFGSRLSSTTEKPATHPPMASQAHSAAHNNNRIRVLSL